MARRGTDRSQAHLLVCQTNRVRTTTESGRAVETYAPIGGEGHGGEERVRPGAEERVRPAILRFTAYTDQAAKPSGLVPLSNHASSRPLEDQGPASDICLRA